MVVVSLFVNPTSSARRGSGGIPQRLRAGLRVGGGGGRGCDVRAGGRRNVRGDHATFVNVERLTGNLCGASRPVHFRGVATVVAKLFNACRPQRAYFGLKDYQQVRVIETMIRDLNFDIELVRCPIVREPDGVAMSSRNSYLSAEERRAATILRRSLVAAGKRIKEGARDGAAIARELREAIETEPLARVDYAEVVDAESLAPRPDSRRGAAGRSGAHRPCAADRQPGG